MRSLSQAQARRIALAAQGSLDRPHEQPTMRTLARTVGRTGVLQVDSVNVLQRAHFMPLYSRMGPYDVDLVRRASEARPRRMVEYWAHVQALMPVDLWPVMRHRMARYRDGKHKWWGSVVTDELTDSLLRRDHRPRGRHGPRPRRRSAAAQGALGVELVGHRRALDYMFVVGDVAIAGRNSQFEIRYDLPERVIPRAHLEAPTPIEPDAVTASWSAARLVARGAPRSATSPTTTGMRCVPGPADRRPPRSWRRARRGGRAGPGHG